MPDINIGSSTDINWIQFIQESTDPIAPDAGLARLYAKSTGVWFRLAAGSAIRLASTVDLATKADSVHTHIASSITDFASAVSANTDVTANTAARHAALSVTDSASIDFTLTGQALTAAVLPGGVDHGGLAGLSDDDHGQYHNDARGDARYLALTNTTPFTPTADYHPATKLYVDTGLGTKAASSHTHTASAITDFAASVSANTDVTANTAARHSAITLGGSLDYLTLAGQVITRGAIDLATDVTGVLPDANVAADLTISGGTVNNSVIGGSTPAAATFTNLTLTNASGARFQADFTNATVANQAMFQSSTTNGFTTVGIIPNGTATTSGLFAYNNSTPTNAATAGLRATSTSIDLLSGTTGSGTALPLTFYTNGSERVRLDTSGNFIVGGATTQTQLSATGAAIFNEQAADADFRIETVSIPSAFFVDASANAIGFGESAPVAFLHINSSREALTAGAANLHTFFSRSSSGANVGVGIGFGISTDSPNSNVGAKIVHIRQGSNSQGDLAFFVKPNTTSGDTTTERMRITYDGNVGIGITAPVHALHLVSTNSTGTTYHGAQISHTSTPGATAISAVKYGLNVNHTVTGTGGSSASLSGASFTGGTAQTAGTISAVFGSLSAVNFEATSGTATVTAFIGHGIYPSISASTVGTITNVSALTTGGVSYGAGSTVTIGASHGLFLNNPGLAAASVAYGIYMAAVTGSATNYAMLINDGLVVFNEGGSATSDFRIEGDTNANLFFVDASADFIGIGLNTPAERLDVSGNIRTSGYVETAEIASPSTPSSGYGRYFTSTTGVPSHINDAGTVTALSSATVGFNAYDAANQTVTAVTLTKLTFTTEDYDTNGWYASSRFTPLETGYYLVGAYFWVEGNGVGYVEIQKNGAGIARASSYSISASATGSPNVAVPVYMNGSTDYLEAYGYAPGTTIFKTTRRAGFWATKI